MHGVEQLFDALRDQAWVAVGSIGTLAAVIVALGAVALDRRERTSEQRKRQARQVSAWIARLQVARPADDDGGPITGVTTAAVLNASDEPVYRVIAWLVLYPGAPGTGEEVAHGISRGGDGPATIGVLPPGSFELDLPAFDPPGMMKRPAVEIAFTDTGSVGRTASWMRSRRFPPFTMGSVSRLSGAPRTEPAPEDSAVLLSPPNTMGGLCASVTRARRTHGRQKCCTTVKSSSQCSRTRYPRSSPRLRSSVAAPFAG
jgi:hypothetical protein